MITTTIPMRNGIKITSTKIRPARRRQPFRRRTPEANMPSCSIWPSTVYGLWCAEDAGPGRPFPEFVPRGLPPIPEMMLAGDGERQWPALIVGVAV